MPDAAGYDIHRRRGNDPFELLVTNHQTDYATYLDADVELGATYTYYVVWLTPTGSAAPPSNEATATPQPRRR